MRRICGGWLEHGKCALLIEVDCLLVSVCKLLSI